VRRTQQYAERAVGAWAELSVFLSVYRGECQERRPRHLLWHRGHAPQAKRQAQGMVKDQAEVSPDSKPSANSGTLSVVNENTVEATPGPHWFSEVTRHR